MSKVLLVMAVIILIMIIAGASYYFICKAFGIKTDKPSFKKNEYRS